jgi:hypothetical protein
LDAGDQKMGIDNGGNRAWDWVNATWDSNLNGKPDTGVMKKGATFKVLVAIEIPKNVAAPATDVTNITVTNKNNKATDWALDTTIIPEFEYLLVPLLAIIIAFVYMKRKKADDIKYDTNGKRI